MIYLKISFILWVVNCQLTPMVGTQCHKYQLNWSRKLNKLDIDLVPVAVVLLWVRCAKKKYIYIYVKVLSICWECKGFWKHLLDTNILKFQRFSKIFVGYYIRINTFVRIFILNFNFILIVKNLYLVGLTTLIVFYFVLNFKNYIFF